MDWINDKQRSLKNKADSEERTKSIDTKTTFEKTFKMPDQNISEKACYAEISVIYTQRNDKVEVEAGISNDECDSSYGNYIVRLKTADEAGQRKTVNHEESWKLENASHKEVVHLYDMDGDVELISARVHGNARDFCKCGNQQQILPPPVQ